MVIKNKIINNRILCTRFYEECHDKTCSLQFCNYIPEYKMSLEGLGWHKFLHRLVYLKKTDICKFQTLMSIANQRKSTCLIRFTVKLTGYFDVFICCRCGKRNCLKKNHGCIYDVKWMDTHVVYGDARVSAILRVIEDYNITSIEYGSGHYNRCVCSYGKRAGFSKDMHAREHYVVLEYFAHKAAMEQYEIYMAEQANL